MLSEELTPHLNCIFSLVPPELSLCFIPLLTTYSNPNMLTPSQASSADSLKRPLTTLDLQTSHSELTNNTQTLEKELHQLHTKILDLESRLFTPHPTTALQQKPHRPKKTKRLSLLLSPRSVVQPTKPKSLQFSPIRSQRSSLNSNTRMTQVHKSQIEITHLEHQEAQKPHKELTIYTEIQKIRHQIQEERKRGKSLYKDNSTLKKQLHKSQALIAHHAKLQENFNSLVVQYDKSEIIRQKQSKIIQLLKTELISRLELSPKETYS